jgi:hypothetical protein
VRIYKSSIEGFAVEVSEGRPLDATPPIVYLQVVQRRRTTSMSTGGVLSVVALDVTVAGWIKEGRSVEWRGSVGSCPDGFLDEIEELWRQGENLKSEVRRLLEGRCEVREGAVSEEPVYGELPKTGG